jgi:hypothetical protein
VSPVIRLPNFGNLASATLLFFFLNHVYMRRKIFVCFFVIGVYVYVFAFYMFYEIFMRKIKFFGLYFEIF